MKFQVSDNQSQAKTPANTGSAIPITLLVDAGVDRTVVSKIERAVTHPSIEILLKLANQLDVDLNDLFAN